MKVCVYWNFHKKVFSLVSNEGTYKGKVIAYCDKLELDDVIFKVSESGRNRVLREKKKNVHAKIYGNLVRSNIIEDKYNLLEKFKSIIKNVNLNNNIITYNPYKYSSFVKLPNEVPINETKGVFCIVKEKKGIILNKKC